jgi:hypothetical protein
MEKVTMYKCRETGRVYDTPGKARYSERKAREGGKKERELKAVFESQRDWVKNNAQYPSDILEMVKEKSLEFWGLDLEIDPSEWRIHPYSIPSLLETCDIVKIRGTIVDKGKCRRVLDREKSIGEALFVRGFTGIKARYPWSGEFGGSSYFASKISIEVEEFPLLKKNYERYVKHCTAVKDYDREKNKARGCALRVARGTEEIRQVLEDIKEIDMVAESLRDSHEQIMRYHEASFMDLWVKSNPPPVSPYSNFS